MMTTSIFYWNLEKFGENKTKNPDYIQAALKAAKPQFIVIIEVHSDESNSESNKGLLFHTMDGPKECVKQLPAIRDDLETETWNLVPPLHTGRGEAVAIYYDSAHWYFTGPNIWTGTSTKPSDGGKIDNYPDDFRNAMSNRPIPAGSPNDDRTENQCAARVITRDRDDKPVAAFSGAGSHSPYLATFTAAHAQEGSCKNLSIVATHGPVARGYNRQYVEGVSMTHEVASDLQDGEVRIIVGDFNLNSLKSDDRINFTPNDAYDFLTNPGSGYESLLKSAGGSLQPKESGGYPSFFATLLRKNQPSYWPIAQTVDTSTYPGYQYTEHIDGGFSPDNVFIKSRGVDLSTASRTILNPIVGSPYTTYDPTLPYAGDCPMGQIFQFNFGKKHSLTQTMSGAPPQGFQKRFTTEYERFYKTSDHLPLVIKF